MVRESISLANPIERTRLYRKRSRSHLRVSPDVFRRNGNRLLAIQIVDELAPRTPADLHRAEGRRHRREGIQYDQQVVDEIVDKRWHRDPVGEEDSVPIIRLSAIPRRLMKKGDAVLGQRFVPDLLRRLRPE